VKYFKKKKPLISIIVATFNSEKTISDTLDSIKTQIFNNYEIIIIDKDSSDKTIEIVKKKKLKTRIYIGKDHGIFDAINKGIKKSRGKIISILHSNDYYYDKYSLENVANLFTLKKVDIVYGNLIYVGQNNKNYIIRYWKSSDFKKNLFMKGWSPPHPAFFCKKKNYVEAGLYKINFGNSADIELMHRFLQVRKFKSYFLNKALVVMRYGGASNNKIINIIKQNLVTLNFLKIKKNFLLVALFIIYKICDRTLQATLYKITK
jgi:glycosyltransferase involved in cell wall biosynthesis